MIVVALVTANGSVSPRGGRQIGTDARWRGAGYNPRDSFHPSTTRAGVAGTDEDDEVEA